jgi:activator of 2-hydroxyglutaryl-CoA dehydratase
LVLCSLIPALSLSTVIYLSGGVAHNDGIVAALADNLGREVLVLTPPQFNGSYGAALLARDKAKTSG